MLVVMLCLFVNGEQVWAQAEVQAVDGPTSLDYRTIDIHDAGIHNPVAMAYSDDANAFFLLQATARSNMSYFL